MKYIISGKIVGFLKFIGEMQQLVRKRSQKNNKDVILHYVSLPIYQLRFPKFCPIQKQLKTLRTCQYLAKWTLACCLSIFLKIHAFLKFDHISRNGNQINYTNIRSAKIIIILIMTAQKLFLMFFRKRLAP